MKQATIILILIAIASASGCIRIKRQAASNPVPAQEENIQAVTDQTVVEYTDVWILLQAGYRGTEPEDFEQMFYEDWYDFYQDEMTKKYFLERAEIEVERIYDDCLADSSTYVGSGRNSLVMVRGLTPRNAEILSVELTKRHIWPDEEHSFSFNGRMYAFRGEGVRLNTEEAHTDYGLEMWSDVIDYKLYLSDGRNEQLILDIPSFDYAFAEILWAGDLDEDGKPDFIIDASRHYEEKTVILFLSSRAGEGEVVKDVSESGYWFDC